MTTLAEQAPDPQGARAEPRSLLSWLHENLRVIWIPIAIFIALTAVSYFAAERLGVSPERAAETNYEEHTALFYRVVFSIQITMVLLTVALCLHIFSRSDSKNRNRTWRWWWTMAYVALLVHLYWAIYEMFGCHDPVDLFNSLTNSLFDPSAISPSSACGAVFTSGRGELIARHGDLERVVEHPAWDLALAFIWGVDVLVMWLFELESKFLVTRNFKHDSKAWRRPHGFVNLLVFGTFFFASVLAPKTTWPARYVGLAMAAAVIGCFLYRTVRNEVDRKSLSWALYVWFFQLVNRLPFARWHHLPKWIALLNLIAVRSVLRDKNLHDTSRITVTNKEGEQQPVEFDVKYLCEREENGQYNYIKLKDGIEKYFKPKNDKIDLERLKREHFQNPAMGNASYSPDPLDSSVFTRSNPGARFGRNIPLDQVADASKNETLYEPSACMVSKHLLARDRFKPVEQLNLLAAAWIQFQVHDWFNHGEPRAMSDKPLKVKLPTEEDVTDTKDVLDTWPDTVANENNEVCMRIRRTRADPTRKANDGIKPETFVNAETHWWDCSQIYGSSRRASHYFRAFHDGKLRTDSETGLLPRDVDGGEISALTANWWLGLSLMHNLFTLEHNAICDYLRGFYPNWKDEQLYRVARLVNNALMAKIHTIDWTCAILDHPVPNITMNATWWGLATEKITKNIGRVSFGEMFSGIPGSATENYDADFCLTEEFVSVYRMHPLLPDALPLHFYKETNPDFDRETHKRTLVFEYTDKTNPDDLILGPMAMANAMKTATFADIAYTFGVEHPGEITLRNFPEWMRKLPRPEARKMPKKVGDPDAELIDLATIDIMRDRERGVPRYNQFRKAFHLPPKKSYKDISNDPRIQEALRKVYGAHESGRDNVDTVDLMVGLFAEKPVQGFGFSDTAFRVFILMASRRLKSDRFFTVDYTPEVYTKPGLDWINANNMRSVLLRHCPQLAPALHDTANAFQPWGKFTVKPEGR